MSQERFICNSKATHAAFIAKSKDMQDEHKYVTYTWRIGPDRSIDQNALVHMWATEYVAHLLNKNKKQVSEGELEGMKRTLKKGFYNETRHPWVVFDIINPMSGESRKEYRSTSNYKVKEMYEFLCWVQGAAAFDGLALDSKGDFAKRQREAQQ